MINCCINIVHYHIPCTIMQIERVSCNLRSFCPSQALVKWNPSTVLSDWDKARVSGKVHPCYSSGWSFPLIFRWIWEVTMAYFPLLSFFSSTALSYFHLNCIYICYQHQELRFKSSIVATMYECDNCSDRFHSRDDLDEHMDVWAH